MSAPTTAETPTMRDTNDWFNEAQAASRTIDRMSRQFSYMRRSLERLAEGKDLATCDAQHFASCVLDKVRKMDEELWKRIPHEGKVS